jgi:hypothetical protein
MEHLQSTKEFVLCDRCSVLRFNDKELGGAVGTAGCRADFLDFTASGG